MLGREMTEEQFVAFLDEGITPVEQFQPAVFPNREGDCIEFLLSNETFKAEQINNFLTVYIGRDSNEVVGGLVEGVSRLSSKK